MWERGRVCRQDMAEPGGTSCAARKHLMRQAINVNCLNVQKLEHRAYVARTPTRGKGGARGEPCARDSCKRRATRDGVGLVNEISWCANPAWVNYANVQAVPRSSPPPPFPPPPRHACVPACILTSPERALALSMCATWRK